MRRGSASGASLLLSERGDPSAKSSLAKWSEQTSGVFVCSTEYAACSTFARFEQRLIASIHFLRLSLMTGTLDGQNMSRSLPETRGS